jgi:hypothetical protein
MGDTSWPVAYRRANDTPNLPILKANQRQYGVTWCRIGAYDYLLTLEVAVEVVPQWPQTLFVVAGSLYPTPAKDCSYSVHSASAGHASYIAYELTIAYWSSIVATIIAL